MYFPQPSADHPILQIGLKNCLKRKVPVTLLYQEQVLQNRDLFHAAIFFATQKRLPDAANKPLLAKQSNRPPCILLNIM